MEARPTQMRPFMKVPVVSTAALHRKVRPKWVFTPARSRLPMACDSQHGPQHECNPGTGMEALSWLKHKPSLVQLMVTRRQAN